MLVIRNVSFWYHKVPFWPFYFRPHNTWFSRNLTILWGWQLENLIYIVYLFHSDVLKPVLSSTISRMTIFFIFRVITIAQQRDVKHSSSLWIWILFHSSNGIDILSRYLPPLNFSTFQTYVHNLWGNVLPSFWDEFWSVAMESIKNSYFHSGYQGGHICQIFMKIRLSRSTSTCHRAF